MSIFEQAARDKLRFDTAKGLLAAEDLWDLPLSSPSGRPNLNDIAVDLHRRLQDAAPISFVETVVATDNGNQLRFDLVKHVIDVRMAENKTHADLAAKAAKKQQIMGLIAEKEGDALKSMTREELEGLLASL